MQQQLQSRGSMWLEWAVRVPLLLTFLTPLLFNSAFLFPFITTKTLYFRLLVEIALIFYSILLVWRPIARPRMNALSWAVVVYFVVITIAAVFGVNPYRSFWGNIERGEGLLTMYHVGVWWFLVWQMFRELSLRRVLVWGFVSVSVLEGFYALFQKLAVDWTWVIYSGASRISGTIGNPAFLAGYLVLGVTAALWLFFDVRSNVGRIVLALAVVFDLVIVYYTSTRGSLVALAVGFLLLAALLTRCAPRGAVLWAHAPWAPVRTVRVRTSFVAILICLIVGVGFIWSQCDTAWIARFAPVKRVCDISFDDITTQSRFYAWDSSWKGLRDRFLLGFGYENYNVAFNKYFHPEIFLDQGSQLWFDRAHNIIFDQAVPNGIVGLVSYLAIFGFALRSLWKRVQHELSAQTTDAPVVYRLLTLGVGLLVYLGQNVFVFDTLSTYIGFYLLLALVLFDTNDNRGGELTQNSKRKTQNHNLNVKTYDLNAPAVRVGIVGITTIAIVMGAYFFNIKPARANMHAIEALVYSNRATNPLPGEDTSLVAQTYYTRTFDAFRKSLAMGTYQSAEVRQKMSEIIILASRSPYLLQDYKQDLFALAIDEMRRNMSESPLDVQNYMYLATLYNASQQFDRERLTLVFEEAQKALRLSPTRPQIYFDMGQAAISLGRYEEGVQYFRKAVELNPRPFESQWNLAAAYILAQQSDEAQKIFDSMIAQGYRFYERDNIKRVDNVYRIAKQLDRSILLYEKARVENVSEAEYFTKALAETYSQLAELRASGGDGAGAREAARKASELDGTLKDETDIFLKALDRTDASSTSALFEAVYRAAFVPNDTLLSFQEYLTQIKAYEAWDITGGSGSVVIAVLDTGVDIDHPDLRENIWNNEDEVEGNGVDDDHNGFIDDAHGWDFVDGIPDVRPKLVSYTELGLHHGTIVSGVMSARGGNTDGIAGITWRSRIMPVRVLSNDGTGVASDVARGIDYAVVNGASIINISFVGDTPSQTIADAIERAYRAGVIVVAAAGNEVSDGINMDTAPRYPVCHDGPNSENWVIGVASVDKNDRKASFSNFGKNCIDLVASGVGIFSTLYHDPTHPDFDAPYGGFWSGTSVSAPMVSATLALLKSLQTDATAQQLRNILKSNLDSVEEVNAPWRGLLGSGRLNTASAVHAAYGVGGKVPSPGYTLGEPVRVIVIPDRTDVSDALTLFDVTGTSSRTISIRGMGDGATAVSADVAGDNAREYIIGAGHGAKPWVKVYSTAGPVIASWLAYAPQFTGGVNIAVGDVDGDGLPEIVVAPQSKGGPHIRVFTPMGKLKYEWFAFSSAWRGGLSLAIGDVNREGPQEIVVGAGAGSTPLVRSFTATGARLSEFMAYNPNFFGGVNIAAYDIDLDGFSEIITAPGKGGGPHVRVFDWKGAVEGQWFAYDKSFRGGVNVSASDIDGDGRAEVVTAPASGGGPHVRVFSSRGDVRGQFFALGKDYRGGLRVAVEQR